MISRRTDLAWEAKELWEESAQETTTLPGVIAREEDWEGCKIQRVEVLDEEGERALGKPPGIYLTLTVDTRGHREPSAFSRDTAAVAAQLEPLLQEAGDGPVLVAGLGNREVTPDAVGPKTVDSVVVTRHLIRELPQHFGDFRPVAAIAPGVLGSTGMESGEMIQAMTKALKPSCVLVVDALASRSVDRLCSTIQISNTGIIPGSGVGNHRMALNRETLGVPVISLGAPTVVEAATLCADLLQTVGAEEEDPALLRQAGGELFVTPRGVDGQVEQLAKILGYGISRALHVDLSVEDVEMFLS